MHPTDKPILPGSPMWQLKSEFAHPRARILFNEPFFWDGIDDHAPWGSDEGADALMFFGEAHDSKGHHPDPARFAKNYVADTWREDPCLDQLGDTEVETISAAQISVIAIALGMYLVHGYVPEELRDFGLEAISRELNPKCLNQFGEPDERVRKLKICQDRLGRAETKPDNTQA